MATRQMHWVMPLILGLLLWPAYRSSGNEVRQKGVLSGQRIEVTGIMPLISSVFGWLGARWLRERWDPMLDTLGLLYGQLIGAMVTT